MFPMIFLEMAEQLLIFSLSYQRFQKSISFHNGVSGWQLGSDPEKRSVGNLLCWTRSDICVSKFYHAV